MTMERRIDALCDALRDGLSKRELKRPCDKNVKVVEYASPAVYPVCLPKSGDLTDAPYQKAPSITVMPGAVTESSGVGTMPITFAVVTWDPGTRKEGELISLDEDGWRSLSGLISEVVRFFRLSEIVGGMEFVDDVRMGLYDSRNTDLRPYYVGWIEARFMFYYEVQSDIVRRLLD